MTSLQSYDELEHFLQSHPISMLIVKSHRCIVCTPIEQKTKTMIRQFPFVSVATTYIDDVPLLASEHLVMSAPTVLLFENGRELHREAGFVSIENLHRILTIFAENH